MVGVNFGSLVVKDDKKSQTSHLDVILLWATAVSRGGKDLQVPDRLAILSCGP